MSDTYTPITQALFLKKFGKGDGTNAFISQVELEKTLHSVVEACTKAKGELFAHDVHIYTEKLSPLAQKAVEKLASKRGYRAVCENRTWQLEYLYSDGGGHYSTDYYNYLEYALIRVSLK